MRCGILIVGAGITGSLLAEHFTRLEYDVCIIDRERPGFGSTAASTAMLLWEIDCPLTELTNYHGFERAADIYRHSVRAVSGLHALVTGLGLDCALRQRSSLYFSGSDCGPRELLTEHDLRTRAGLPGFYIDYRTLQGEFGFSREAALLSPGAADADPLLLSRALVATAAARGATVFDAEAMTYDPGKGCVLVGLDNGYCIEAEHVVLATGYVIPECVKSDLHGTSSSWALATPPQRRGGLWRDGLLLWEASEHYIYARTTADNRIIIGGEDDDALVDPAKRDEAMPRKAAALLAKLSTLVPQADAVADFIWSGAFGETLDGLPLIGRVPGIPRLFAAYGYGGNGITFSFLASRVLAAMVAGRHEPWYEGFALDRTSPAA